MTASARAEATMPERIQMSRQHPRRADMQLDQPCHGDVLLELANA